MSGPRQRLPAAAGGGHRPPPTGDARGKLRPGRARAGAGARGAGARCSIRGPRVLPRLPPPPGGLREVAPLQPPARPTKLCGDRGWARLGKGPPTHTRVPAAITDQHAQHVEQHEDPPPLHAARDPRRPSQRVPSRPSRAAGSHGRGARPNPGGAGRTGERRAGRSLRGEGADSAPAPPDARGEEGRGESAGGAGEQCRYETRGRRGCGSPSCGGEGGSSAPSTLPAPRREAEAQGRPDRCHPGASASGRTPRSPTDWVG